MAKVKIQGHASGTGIITLTAPNTSTDRTVTLPDADITLGEATPTSVSDQANTSTGYFDLPAGTTAQRPGSPATGWTRMNTTTGTLEFYDGTSWVSTNLVPTVASVTGVVYTGAASTLTIAVTNNTSTVDVKYYESTTLLATEASVAVSSGSLTSTVPSAVYGQTAGDTITIKIANNDGTPSSNGINETVMASPTGGTITTSGNYRIHTFTSSGDFVVASSTSVTADHLIVAGGGGTGWDVGGGGGAGGKIYTSGASLSAATYGIVIGAGGASASSINNRGVSGANSTGFSLTAIGGGGGGGHSGSSVDDGLAGGSGGGGGTNSGDGGAGTSGQGYAGADASPVSWGTGGGGGAGADDAATNAGGGSTSGYAQGGSPYVSSISGSSYKYSGGGFGSNDGTAHVATGTNGAGVAQGIYGWGANGIGSPNASSYNGAPGVVIIRYIL